MILRPSHLLFLAAITLPAFALAGGRDGDGPHGPRRGPPPHELLIENADELGLDDATVARIQDLADAAKADMDQLRTAAETARGTDAEQSIHQAMRERGKILMDAIRAELTDEQWAAAREILPPPPDGRGPGGRGGEGRGPRAGAGEGAGPHDGDCPHDD